VGQAINVQLGQGVTASQVGQISEVSTGNISGAFVTSGGATTGGTLSLSGLSITGADGTAYTFTGGTAGSAQDVADAINAADVNGVSAAVSDNGGINIYSQGSLSVNGAAVTGSASAAASRSPQRPPVQAPRPASMAAAPIPTVLRWLPAVRWPVATCSRWTMPTS